MNDPKNLADAENHYFEAQYWLDAIKGLHGRRLQRYRNECIAKAQVHATLALAAATMRQERVADDA